MSRFSGEQLDRLRQTGDALADPVIEQLFAEGSVDAVNDLMSVLVRNDGLPPALLPEVVRRYLDASDDLPPIDRGLLQQGEDVFADLGPEVLMILGFYSLPSAYAARKGVQVLYRTGYLNHRPIRRVFETTQMVVDVLRPGGLSEGGVGLRTIQKVRLMHAAVRHLIQRDPKRSWPAENGVPINQEDMAGTLMTFSFIVLDGLDKLNIRLSEQRREAYLYAWLTIGRLMGVVPELLPRNMEEAAELTKLIYSRQIAASEEGAAMTRALIEGMERLVPGTSLDGIPVALIHHFLRKDPFGGRDVAKLLGVPPQNWTAWIVRGMVGVSGMLGAFGLRDNPARRSMRRVSIAFIDGLLRVERGGQRAPFEIPEWLGESWGVPKPPAKAAE